MFQSVKYPDKVALKYTCENINQELPVICAGSITKVEDADKALEFGASIVAFGRAAIGNANLPKYFEKGESLPFATPFIVANLKKIDVNDKFIHYITAPGPLSSMNVIKQ